MEGEDNTFLLSFADALTCIFGAAVALFMIFVVLVKLDPAAPRLADEISEQPSRSTRMGQLLRTGSGDVLLQIISARCEDLDAIELRPAARNTWEIRSAAGQTPGCARLFEIPAGADLAGTELVAHGQIRDRLELRLIAGATVWPPAASFSYRAPERCAISGRLAWFQNDPDMPLSVQECGS